MSKKDFFKKINFPLNSYAKTKGRQLAITTQLFYAFGSLRHLKTQKINKKKVMAFLLTSSSGNF
jgi:hypothetical protein